MGVYTVLQWYTISTLTSLFFPAHFSLHRRFFQATIVANVSIIKETEPGL